MSANETVLLQVILTAEAEVTPAKAEPDSGAEKE